MIAAMPLFLSRRLTGVRERMEDPDCDPGELCNTYAQFRAVNRLVSSWRGIYRGDLRPAADGRRFTVLDVGFGGGDLPLRLERWAARDGLDLAITAIDTDPRAVSWARERYPESAVSFHRRSLKDLLDGGERFDAVISNHLLHHFSCSELVEFCAASRRLSRRVAIHHDIVRSDLAWMLFALVTTPFFHRSFIVADGLTSIRRSFTVAELRRLAPAGWQVRKSPPYHQSLIHRRPP